MFNFKKNTKSRIELRHLATLFIILNCTLSPKAFAQEIPSDRVFLQHRLESSNIETNRYTWEFKITPSVNSDKKLDIQLLNPHPELTLLNQRALSIVEENTLEDVEAKIDHYNIIAAMKIQDNQPTKAIDHVYQSVRFQPQPSYLSRKPQFRFISSYFNQVCKMTPKQHPLYQVPDLIDLTQRRLNFTLVLNFSSQGTMTSFSTKPLLEDPAFDAALAKDLERVKFYPNNYNGEPQDFNIQQPLTLICVKQSFFDRLLQKIKI